MSKSTSILERRRKEKEDKNSAIQRFMREQLETVWFDARTGVHLVRKSEVIVPDKDYLKALEHPLANLIQSKAEIHQRIRSLDAEIKHDRSVQCHGPVAGQKTGTWLECSGSKWLMTSSPRYVEPKTGKWPNLRRLIETMFPV
jgi:hypothetical protein